jgi:hypothetical protein
MPRGPKGEKRPADVVGNAIHVMRIATGEIEENVPPEGGLLRTIATPKHKSSDFKLRHYRAVR